MKPEFEKVAESPERSFLIRVVERPSRPALSQAWHFHPEIEICYTHKSHGRRFVGNQISDYAEHDLVMLGSNLPHGFTTDVPSSQVVLQMTQDFLGRDFLDKPELHPIKRLFRRSTRGLVFQGATKERVRRLLPEVLHHDGIPQLLRLLELLHVLAVSEDVSELCANEYAMDLTASHAGRIQIVYDHVMDHYQDEIDIKHIANKVSLSEAAFYKFIKRTTKKTYTQIVNEFRIYHAGRMLMSTSKSISEVGYESGYNNMSYFNRKFKSIMQKTPREFRAQYMSRGS
ncbi:MAG: helix-turn-helix domain-containing protein [Bacteroidota bacterium]